MHCDLQHGENPLAFFERFSLKALQQRTPVLGSIELTARCNLNCVHCYISNDNKRTNNNHWELTTHQWMDLIDQFTEAGCLYLLLTGGETMLRPDFSEIYSHACRKGLLVTVFTNGTLVSESILDTFKAFPPYCIEVSLYGVTAETYEKITGAPGSFEKCLSGIEQLKAHGFNLKLKTMLLTLNDHELEAMQALAADFGTAFRFDAAIFPKLDGDPSPMQYRVSPEIAVKKESLDRQRVKQWHDFYHRMKNLTSFGALYECGAGVTMFHVDACGMLMPCVMVPGASHDLMQDRFENIWYKKAFTLFRGPGKMPISCQGCDDILLCGYCPGFSALETGKEQMPSPFLCEIGEQRKQMIQNFESEERINENKRVPGTEKESISET